MMLPQTTTSKGTGDISLTSVNWEVTTPHGAMVADSRNGSISISKDGTVVMSNGRSTEYGLYLSGGLSANNGAC